MWTLTYIGVDYRRRVSVICEIRVIGVWTSPGSIEQLHSHKKGFPGDSYLLVFLHSFKTSVLIAEMLFCLITNVMDSLSSGREEDIEGEGAFRPGSDGIGTNIPRLSGLTHGANTQVRDQIKGMSSWYLWAPMQDLHSSAYPNCSLVLNNTFTCILYPTMCMHSRWFYTIQL